MHGQAVEVGWRFLGDEPDGEAVSVIRWKREMTGYADRKRRPAGVGHMHGSPRGASRTT